MNRLKLNLMVLCAAFMLLGFVGDGFAQGRNRGGNRNGNCANKGVKQGVRSGQINGDELQVIRQDQQTMRQERRVYRSDGVLTDEERNDMRNDKRALGALIRQSRRN